MLTRRATIASAAATVLLILGFVATPTQAAGRNEENRHASGCMWGQNGVVSLNRCGVIAASLYRWPEPNYNGHQVVSIAFSANSMCIDSGAQTSGSVRTHPCNHGNYQFFEVFYGSVSGTRVLKSIGAWEHQHVHICIYSTTYLTDTMRWGTCNTKNAADQFKFWTA